MTTTPKDLLRETNLLQRYDTGTGHCTSAFCDGMIDVTSRKVVHMCAKECWFERVEDYFKTEPTTNKELEIMFLIGRLKVLGVDIEKEGRQSAFLSELMEIVTGIVDSEEYPAGIRYELQQLLFKWQRGI